jgi:glycine dehydrogenase subunit 2
MKYNPKSAEAAAAWPGFARVHPLQPDATAQGSLELLWRLERALCEVTGMARATLQPPAGACGELTGLLIMRAYHASQGRQRTKVLIPDAAHGTNPASVRLGGYQAVSVPADERGLVDVEALRSLVDDDVAGLMLTNPNTLGLFEERIEEITDAVHEVGGLVYYDGANLNAILGKCRPGDMGFDIVHINTHKTFATPHGGGGPGAGPVGVVERLTPFLPVPRVERDDGTGAYRLETEAPSSIGRMHGFHGNVGVLVRAYLYVFLHGSDGLEEVAERAVLNANYLASLLPGETPLAFPDGRPMHEFVATATPLEKATGIRAMDLAKRLIDLGYHPSTVYFPLVVDEAKCNGCTNCLDVGCPALLVTRREQRVRPSGTTVDLAWVDIDPQYGAARPGRVCTASVPPKPSATLAQLFGSRKTYVVEDRPVISQSRVATRGAPL